MTIDKQILVSPKDDLHLVWDLPVRLFHSLLVLSVVGAFVTNKLGVSYFKYHVWCGYAVIVLVSFRIIWGVVGTHHAKFWNFIRGPVTTLRYLWQLVRGQEQSYAGHNPLGAVMVVALLLALAVQAVSGLFGNDEIFNVGPLTGYVSADFSLQLTSLHRKLFLGIGAAVGLHVLAVLAHLVFKRERLLRAMVTGRKPSHHFGDAEPIHSSRTWLAGVLVVALSLVLAWVIGHAPQAVVDITLL
jgi:cytochrome b